MVATPLIFTFHCTFQNDKILASRKVCSIFTAVKRLRMFLFSYFEKIIHVNVEASVRIYEIAAEGKYIFSSLKRDSLLLKCSAPDQNCFDNGADSRHFAVFKRLELF